MTEYTSQKNKVTYESPKSDSYTLNNTQLKVIQYQVKEKKGICTCEKKVPCRGTCIPR